jgi:hypothetical protein
VDGARSALIIASDDYTDAGLRRLRAPANDAQALAAVLRDPGIGGFEVRTLLNKPAHEVNLAVEEFFADRRPDDLLLMHFSCHGVKDEGGELYFAMANTVLRRLGATAVAAEFVNRRMSRSRSRRVVLLLDCCYAGAFERGMTARAGEGMGIESQFGGRGRAVITASSAMEYAFEGGELTDTRESAPSVFTSALVEGLETGDADRDQDGQVALDELYDYIYDKVRTVTPNQTPGKWAFGVQGELVIARRARPVTAPVPLPPELQEAIDSPLAGVRGAVVQELARLLHGKHAGRALAARLALERLTGDDSRTVASAAATALSAQVQQQPEQGPPEPATPELGLPVTIVAEAPEHATQAEAAEREIRAEPQPSAAAQAPDQRGRATLSGGHSILPVGPATPDGTQPPGNLGKPPGKQRTRFSGRARILAGSAGALILLIVVIVVIVVTSSGSAPPSPTSLLPATATIFQDNFSSLAFGWPDTATQSGNASFNNGVYRVYVTPNPAGGTVFSSPKKASSVYPSAPADIRVEVDARIVPGSVQARGHGYFVACRVGQNSGYAFTIRNDSVSIDKYFNYGSGYKQLKSAGNSAVHLNGYNLLQAQCTSIEGGQGVQLVFSVNGRVVATATDTDKPLQTGSVGLGVSNDNATKPAEAEFDNLVVRQV